MQLLDKRLSVSSVEQRHWHCSIVRF